MTGPKPVTGPYHGPSLADQLRLIEQLAGTTSRRGVEHQREAIAYVATVTNGMLVTLKALLPGIDSEIEHSARRAATMSIGRA